MKFFLLTALGIIAGLGIGVFLIMNYHASEPAPHDQYQSSETQNETV